MNFLPIDIETAPMVSYHWTAKTDYIQSSMNFQPTTILMAAWRRPDCEIESVSVKDFHKRLTEKSVRQDYGVTKKLHELLRWCADENIILVYQNGDKFDIPKIVGRAIFHGMKPIPVKQLAKIDTLKEARKMGFDYCNLDALDRELNGCGKVETRGWAMWRDVVHPTATHEQRLHSLEEMIRYNEGDILALERVFERLRPHMTTFPNMNHWTGTAQNCPQCGSPQTIYRTQPIYGSASTSIPHRRKSCNNCGKWFRENGVMRNEYGHPLPRPIVS